MLGNSEAQILARVYSLILTWPEPGQTAPSEDLGGETLEAGRWVSSEEDDNIHILPPREKSK
jgi:hypothetical protein